MSDYTRDHTNDVDVIITRQTHQERNFLAPARKQADIVKYVSVLKMLQNQQVPTGLMTTMTSLCVSLIDTNGERAEYTQQCHGLLARHRNMALGRHDTFWNCSPPGETLLLDPWDAIEALAEMFCAPIELGLVEHLRHWEGAKILPDHWMKPMRLHPVVQRKRATYREVIRFTPVPPKVLTDHFSVAEARDLVNKAIAHRSEFLNDTRRERLGRSRVLRRPGCRRIDPLARDLEPRRPRPAHVRGTRAQVEKAMNELCAKRDFYRQCRELFAGEHKDVVFAPGTVMMRKLGAYCDPLPPSRTHIPPAQYPRPPTHSSE